MCQLNFFVKYRNTLFKVIDENENLHTEKNYMMGELHSLMRERFIKLQSGFLVEEYLKKDPVQSWLEYSSMAPVVSAVKGDGESMLFSVLKMTRNYCHGLYKERCAQLN